MSPSKLIRHVALGLIVMLAQWLVLGRLQVWGAFPDAVLLYVAVMSLRYGRQIGAVNGFFFGFLMDAVYDTWGIQMLTKTLTGFLLGLVPGRGRENTLILPRQAFLGGLALSIVHHGLLVTFLALEAGASNSFMVLSLWLGSALYTAVLGFIVALFNLR